MNDTWFEQWRNASIGGILVCLLTGFFMGALAVAGGLAWMYYFRSLFPTPPPPQANDADRLLEELFDESVERALRRRAHYRR